MDGNGTQRIKTLFPYKNLTSELNDYQVNFNKNSTINNFRLATKYIIFFHISLNYRRFHPEISIVCSGRNSDYVAYISVNLIS